MDERFEELLAKALKLKVTDIHFTINDNKVVIAFRTIIKLVSFNGNNDDLKLFNYLQYLAHLDLTNNNPQSGSFNYFYKNNYYDFRFSTICNKKTKSGVLRILNCHKGLKIEEITFQKDIQESLLNNIHKHSGLIIFSGLTGSGKTTTIYSLLTKLENKSIYSLEDPIEVSLDNVVQLEINEKLGFGYDEGIKQILRHNPDVLMIGEIRDENTAKMALRASLTGVLVITSLHSSSTITALCRLLELGVNKNDLMECLAGLYCQRLLKKKGVKDYICVFDYLDNEGIRAYLKQGKGQDNLDRLIFQAKVEGQIEEND